MWKGVLRFEIWDFRMGFGFDVEWDRSKCRKSTIRRRGDSEILGWCLAESPRKACLEPWSFREMREGDLCEE
jgi:hypothetical protein